MSWRCSEIFNVIGRLVPDAGSHLCWELHLNWVVLMLKQQLHFTFLNIQNDQALAVSCIEHTDSILFCFKYTTSSSWFSSESTCYFRKLNNSSSCNWFDKIRLFKLKLYLKPTKNWNNSRRFTSSGISVCWFVWRQCGQSSNHIFENLLFDMIQEQSWPKEKLKWDAGGGSETTPITPCRLFCSL